MRNRRRNFTLVELLVVIGIIAILAGMLMAGIMYAPAKAQKAKAQAEITTLVNAIKQYESAYGVLPIPNAALKDSHALKDGDNVKDGKLWNEKDNDGDSNKKNYYKQMILILQADTDNSEYDALKKQNKRNTRFLDIQGNNSGSYTDPWGNDYNVYVDATYDGKISLGSGNSIPGLSDNVYRYSVVIYSKGNDRKDSTDGDKKAKYDEDNVYSFPTTWSSSTNKHTISK
jgi:prepilin-type N-terminal cleavage/methylation domain-containing protein